jgi:Asp-tRNA(Asn)/Glu-tRNA(Gln) amidotransferase A subunit family amidase
MSTPCAWRARRCKNCTGTRSRNTDRCAGVPNRAASGPAGHARGQQRQNGALIQNTDPGSNAGIPGLQLPSGLGRDGLPIGLELDGPAGSDRHLLALGLAIEPVLGRLPCSQ